MSYEKQNFEDGQVLEAEHLNHMEDGIEKANDTLALVGTASEEVLYDGAFTSMDLGDGLFGALIEGLSVPAGKNLIVVYDGVKYFLKVVTVDSLTGFGNTGALGFGEDTGEPFVFILEEGGLFGCLTDTAETEHTLKVEKVEFTVPIGNVVHYKDFWLNRVSNKDWLTLYLHPTAPFVAGRSDIAEVINEGYPVRVFFQGQENKVYFPDSIILTDTYGSIEFAAGFSGYTDEYTPPTT